MSLWLGWMALARMQLDAWLGDRPDRGATMVEYSIMVVLVAAVAFLAVATMGVQVNTLYQAAVDQWP